MDNKKVNTKIENNEKGACFTSHYRMKKGGCLDKAVIAMKFVSWDVPALESLSQSKVYKLRQKLNVGGHLTREDKNWLCEQVNSNSYFRTAVPLMGYRFDFLDVLKKYLVCQYGVWSEYYAPDRTSLRNHLLGKVQQIVEIPKH